ncbi:MAG: eukaryotic-like serine/threonine-protein kinase [Pyrinomonadaceae bacterium]|nr:eukaryotic-like serine/threonine-protein kinase [Pyrinomonadaceae bacterium]
MTSHPHPRAKVFISYSHKDIRWVERFHIHLKPLEREGIVERWDDTMLKPGSQWREEIKKAIKVTKVAVLFISADFLASDFIATNELPPLLTAADRDGAVIIPVIIGHSRFARTPSLSRFQTLRDNPPSKPLGSMTKANQEKVLVRLTEAIEKALNLNPVYLNSSVDSAPPNSKDTINSKTNPEAEAQRLAAAKAELRRADEERRRAEQERLAREAEESARQREAELEEDHTVETQQAITSTRRIPEAMPSDLPAVKPVEEPPPEIVVLTDGESVPPIVVPIGRYKRSTLIGMIALVILAVVVIFTLVHYGESNNKQSSSSTSSAGNSSSLTEQGADTSAGNLSGATAPPPAQSVVPPTGMAYVSGAEFTMGRDGDPTRYESPAHKVTVNSFFIDLYEVTREDYQKCVDEEECQPPSVWGSNKFPGGTAKLPVTGVTWDDANAYASWAGKRLPTEEEWEFAARGGKKGFRYPWGNEWKDGLANANSASKGLMEVGSYKGTSPFSMSDMVGNAWEWTASKLTAYKKGQPLPNKPPGDLRVIRGGSYIEDKNEATTTYRRGYPARGVSYDKTGFRCAKDMNNSSGRTENEVKDEKTQPQM